MTIRRRYQITLVIVLALFLVNILAYFWSARGRTVAKAEWTLATEDEFKLASVRKELDLLHKEAVTAGQLQEENNIPPAAGEFTVFERRTTEALTIIDGLQRTASPQETAAVDEFRRSYLSLRSSWLDSYRHAGTGKATDDAARAEETAQVVFGRQLPNLQSLEDFRVMRAERRFADAENFAHRVMIATFLLSILVAFGLSYLLSRHLDYGFTTLKGGAHRIGNMDLDHRIRYPGADEFAELAQSFNEMAEKLFLARRSLVESNKQLSTSESRYRKMVDRSAYGIYRCASDGKVLDANPAMVRMLGYDDLRELVELPSIERFYCDPADYQTLLERLREKGSVEGFEVQLRTRSGALITTRLSGNLVFTGDGFEREMIAENVTTQRALEDQLRQAQKMEAIGQLAGGIAHDFNNLLTVIKGHSELLRSELRSGDSARKEVDGVMRAADRAVSLTRQLLAFSRRQLLSPQIIDLNSIVSSMQRLLGRLLGENIELSTDLSPKIGAIKADPHQIEQVIMNLAVNARDAMPAGGRLTITTCSLEVEEEEHRGKIILKPDRYVHLAVIDTGTGMDVATLSRAFEPFFTTKEQGKGTGLGLATVYGVVKQSEGEIWVESEPGRGAAFHICFPRALGREKTQRKAKITEAPPAKGTILLVEDEEDVREVASTMLERRGYQVLVASKAAEAEAICASHSGKIHLLLTDVVLRDCNGPDLAETLTGLRPQMKVLFMSGYTDDVVLKHGIQDSQVAFLPKPFTRDELENKVRETLSMAVVQPSGT